MFKKIFGLTMLLVLIGIVIGNLIDHRNENKTNETEDSDTYLYDVTGDTNVKGGAIAPAESVGIEQGKLAPDFELETLDGEQFKLSDLQGKKVILNFWATWCPPCREEMPGMQQYYEENQDEVVVVAVNLTDKDTSEQAARNFIDEYGFTYPIPLDRDGDIAKEYGVIVVPTTYFIGTDGIVQQPRVAGPLEYDYMTEMVNALN